MPAIIYLIFGHFFLGLGVLGALLPILPTTPFLLLATFCYSKGSPRFHHWILQHKIFGPPIKKWEEKGAISLRAKVIATMAISLVLFIKIIPNLAISLIVKVIIALILTLVLIFIWSRPRN